MGIDVRGTVKRWRARNQALRSARYALVLFVNEGSFDSLESTLAACYSLSFPIPRNVVVFVTGQKRVPKKKLTVYPVVRRLVSLFYLDQGGRERALAAVHALWKRGLATVFFEATRFDPESLEALLSSAREHPRAISLRRAFALRCRASRGLAIETSSSLFCPVMRERHDLLPLCSQGIAVPPTAGISLSRLPSPPHVVSPEVFDLWFAAAVLASEVPVICSQSASMSLAAEPELDDDSDFYASALQELQRAYGAFASPESRPLEDFARDASSHAKGNVLLMAWSGIISGADLSLLYLAKHLSALGENVHLVIPFRGLLEGACQREDMDYYLLDNPAYKWVSPMSFSEEEEQKRIAQWSPYIKEGIDKLKVFIRENDIELVHENVSTAFMAASAAESLGVPLVWHLREFNEEDHHLRLWPSYKPYEHFARADACVCISKSIRDKYEPLIPANNLVLIYNGCDPEVYANLDHRPFEHEERVLIACAGCVQLGKGQLDLARAFVQVAPDYPELSLELAGSVNEFEYLDEIKATIADADLDQRFVYSDVVIDMHAFWSATDIAVVPSHFEAFGRCAVEAMMAGCLVIGNDSAGTAEIIEHGTSGLLYARDDVDDLARKIRWALEHRDEAKELASRGRQRALSTFTSKVNAEAVFALHQRILQSERSV